MASQRQSALCPNCRKLINVNEPRCPYCNIPNPGKWWKRYAWSGAMTSAEQMISLITYANVAMFVLSLLVNPSLSSFSLNPFALLSPDNRSLILLGATGTYPISQMDRWWSLLSASYLHGGVLHIFFNMAALRQIGPLVLQEYGAARFFLIYTISGVIGFWISYLAGIPLTIGASAALCGLLGAAIYYGKSRGGAYGSMIYGQISGWAASIFIFGLLMPGINNWGHGGGLIAGMLLGLLVGYNEKRRENLYHKALAGACLAMTVLTLAWAILNGLYYRLLM